MDSPAYKDFTLKISNIDVFVFQAAEVNSNTLATVEKLSYLQKLTWALSNCSSSSIILDDNENAEQQEQWIPFQLKSDQSSDGSSKSQYLNKADLIEKLKKILPKTDINVIEDEKLDSGLSHSYFT